MTITGAILRNAVIYAAQLITSHRQEIDALNVFPVPDGDTGTNMSMTITNASREVRLIPAIGKNAGEELNFGGLLGSGPIMPLNTASPAKMISRGGRIPAPLQSLKN